MRGAVELSDVHDIVFVLENGGLVVVDIEVVGCREDGHDTGESSCSGLSIHSVTSILGFVSSDDRQEVVFLEEIASSRIGEEVRATSHVIVDKVFGGFFLTKFFQWISPKDIAHQAMGGGFSETINLGIVRSVIVGIWGLTDFRSSKVCSSGLRPP